MEDRYEIRGRIGQGGIGSVHRAYDHRMRREVAIKRILTSSDDIHLEAEATKQLMTEVGALASLQHPHIVTVFDVGSDEQGPYIVMELINGKTLDEIVEQAPLVWRDFKVLAMQTLEALIAAQELDMIHSDLKPPNIMLTWLPSGAFQVKIVDFGLAVLVQNQSQEEIEKMEAIYGSIFFMPPEQYERKTLDTRSDLYSLGCCFYQALAGTYPFNGQTGMEVMQAHLNHTVTPIQELRSDIPLWACEWIMWLISRLPDDRPPSAREALAYFLQHDKESNPVMSRGANAPTHSRLIIPGTSTGPVPALRNTGPVPALRNTGPVPNPATTPVPALRNTGPVPASPSTSSVPTAPAVTSATSAYSYSNTGVIQVDHIPESATLPTQKKSSKKPLLFAILAVVLILLGGGGWWVMKNMGGSKEQDAYLKIVSQAERNDVGEVNLTSQQLQVVMDYIVNNPFAYLSPAYATLAKAKATDGSDFDATILQFVTTSSVPAKVRELLFEEVIAKRTAPTLIPALLEFSANASSADEGLAAFDAIRDRLREEHAAGIAGIIAATDHTALKNAADTELKELIANSQNKAALATIISKTLEGTVKSKSRPVLERLLERCKPATP